MEAAGAQEATSLQQHNQAQLELGHLRVVTKVEPATSPLRAEGEAMLEVAAFTRRVALTLPERSEVRADLLESAADWTCAARLNGVRPAQLLSA